MSKKNIAIVGFNLSFVSLISMLGVSAFSLVLASPANAALPFESSWPNFKGRNISLCYYYGNDDESRDCEGKRNDIASAYCRKVGSGSTAINYSVTQGTVDNRRVSWTLYEKADDTREWRSGTADWFFTRINCR
ncbi:MAG: hypothetical protein HCA25_22590 [Dolichospermum sp. DET50]|nr:hypothetical protein [Dolichospermum sp. DET66]MBS3034959.1 hypothetical protein [Dolichospermum sp. DET67]MBS3040159.1 hypothetical protein [Dolichospermum sp. DET50]QSX67334.1 MAG: hypothetical protein EZY12_21865 [Dolichospermum sp. DET69]